MVFPIFSVPTASPSAASAPAFIPLDPAASGGEYTLSVSDLNNRFPEQRCKFLVNTYQKPRLDKELDFGRPSYGPGEEVQARGKARRAEAGPLAEKDVEVTILIDGKTYGANGQEAREPLKRKTDIQGIVDVRFKLPAPIEKGQASLALKFTDGGNVETIVRPIPLVLNKLQVEFFPEGGDLVAGLPNRVYFQVRTPLGKPADLRGRLLEDGKPLPIEVATLNDVNEPGVNQGLGRFTFTPKFQHGYELQVDSPVGIRERFPLPPPREEGVVLTVPEGVVDAAKSLPITVRSTPARPLLVGLYCRGQLLDSVEIDKGQTEATLRPVRGAGGVYRVTVFEEQPDEGPRRNLKPVAERLVYRRPADPLIVNLRPDRPSYVPGQKVNVDVETLSDRETPAPAIVLLRVVDRSVLNLADDKTHRGMPAHFLLASEVRRPEDLEYADFLLGPQPKAALALDLLLGTQGWRRFTEQGPGPASPSAPDRDRIFVAVGQPPAQWAEAVRQEINKVNADHAEQVAHLEGRFQEANQRKSAAETAGEYKAALARVENSQRLLHEARVVTQPVLWAFLALAALVCLLLALKQSLRRAVPYYAGTVVAGVALILVFVFPVPGGLPVKHGPGPQVAFVFPPREKDVPIDPFPGIGRGNAGGRQTPRPIDPRITLQPVLPHNMVGGQVRMGFGGMGGGPDNARNLWQEQIARMEARNRAGQMGGGPNGFGPRERVAPPERPRPSDPRLVLPMVVREYAHVRPPAVAPADRSDFTETLYWHPVLVLPGGKTRVSFDLCDSVTTFQVLAFAHTTDGKVGAATQVLESRLPFTLQPKTPLEVTASDTLAVPLAIANNTREGGTVHVTLKQHNGLALAGEQPAADATVPAGAAAHQVYRFRPALKEGEALLAFEGKTAAFGADGVQAKVRVVPEGFPVVQAFSDVLEKSASQTLVLPEKWIKDTLKCRVDVFPSTLADLEKGLEALLREPHGCFEQTSTSNYPNVLILDYLKESEQVRPDVERRARDLLARGYQKLTSFECLNPARQQKEGYEWFGGTVPPHEALTAYGLMQFCDLARYQEVDPAMVERTRQYLLSRRDGKGGFQRNPRALDTFGRAPEPITNAYIVWSLTESGKEDVTVELNALTEQAARSNDPYFLSLVANSLINRGKTAAGLELLKKVAAVQKEDGHLDAEQTSITGSGGRDLQIETTALAVLGWLKAQPGTFNVSVQKAVRWLGQQRGGSGGFGSTQSTLLALKALIAYTKANKKTSEAGELRLFVGDKLVAQRPFTAGISETLTLEMPQAENLLKPGRNSLRLEITGKNVFPYTLTCSYQTLQPPSTANCPVRLSTRLAKTELEEGETVRLTATVENVSGQGQGMAVAILGLPGGLTLPEDLKQLKDHARAPEDGRRPLISMFEVQGRELILYWRDLAPGQKIEVPVDLIGRVPGEYSGPASRAYLYYNADRKHWTIPLKVHITPKGE
jgi:hypothetical protein